MRSYTVLMLRSILTGGYRMKSTRPKAYLVLAAVSFILAVPFLYAQAAAPKNTGNWGIVIHKKDITAKATFIPYKANGLAMEIIAVRATDGTVRTALNTCQVCYRSGRGYYKQVGNVFVCQNCGNAFQVDQVEKIKGGCNPIPILEEDKTVFGDSIGISKEYLASAAPYFAMWKKNG
jgi:hypothetical protein